jgi:hypothetical protein
VTLNLTRKKWQKLVYCFEGSFEQVCVVFCVGICCAETVQVDVRQKSVRSVPDS